jgi:hypothetical protein
MGARNRATQPGGIGSLELILGLLKRLKIRALLANSVPGATAQVFQPKGGGGLLPLLLPAGELLPPPLLLLLLLLHRRAGPTCPASRRAGSICPASRHPSHRGARQVFLGTLVQFN